MSRVVVFLDQKNTGDCLEPLAAPRTMSRRQTLPKQIPIYIIFALLLPFVLGACAIKGDLGRPKPTMFGRVADRLLPSATYVFSRRRSRGMTHDEMVMRKAGLRLSNPLISRPRGALRRFGGFAFGGYGARSARSANGHPLAAIEEELRSDHLALTRFGTASRRVLVIDKHRMQAVYETDRDLMAGDNPSSERISENFAFMKSTFEGIGRRQQAFYHAIDAIRVSTPDATTTALEGSLNHLRDRSASLEYELTDYFRSAVARGNYQPLRFASRERPRYGPPVPYRPSDQPASFSFK